MKTGKIQRLAAATLLAGIVGISGCATAGRMSDWATVNKGSADEDWKKRTGWENETKADPGLWGILAGLGSLVNK